LTPLLIHSLQTSILFRKCGFEPKTTGFTKRGYSRMDVTFIPLVCPVVQKKEVPLTFFRFRVSAPDSIAIAGAKAARQMASDGWSTSCSMRVIRSGGNQGKKALSICFFQRAELTYGRILVCRFDSFTLLGNELRILPTSSAFSSKRRGIAVKQGESQSQRGKC
jgi:hypothetical protein